MIPEAFSYDYAWKNIFRTKKLKLKKTPEIEMKMKNKTRAKWFFRFPIGHRRKNKNRENRKTVLRFPYENPKN